MCHIKKVNHLNLLVMFRPYMYCRPTIIHKALSIKMDSNQTTEVQPTRTNFSSSTDDLYLTIVFYFKLCLLIFGCLGNGLCIVIWMKKEFIKMSRSFCCIILSLVDTTYLILDFSAAAYSYIEKGNIFFISGPVCRFLFFGVAFAQHMDSWIIVLLTIERLISGIFNIT